MYYYYRSPIGIFTVKIHKFKWGLFFNDELLGVYDTPVGAADDVYLQVTGYYEWDSLQGVSLDIPTDIYEWEKITI